MKHKNKFETTVMLLNTEKSSNVDCKLFTKHQNYEYMIKKAKHCTTELEFIV